MSGNILRNDRINGADNNLVKVSHNPTAPRHLCSSCLRNATTTTENDVSTPTASYNVLNLSETTPLLTTTNSSLRIETPALNIWQKMWLGFFLTIVVVASGIGIYLLFQEEDRQLPESFELIPKYSWLRDSHHSPIQLEESHKNDGTNNKNPPTNQIPPQYLTLPVSKVVLSQSNTTSCIGLHNCKTFLNGFLQIYQGDMPYNFLIDSAGRVYEGKGWFLQAKCDNRLDRLYYCDDVLSIAFIGPQDSKPTLQQISSLRSFLDYSVTKGFLDRCYEIQVRIHNFSKKRYFIDIAFEIQNAHRKLNKCSVYL